MRSGLVAPILVALSGCGGGGYDKILQLEGDPISGQFLYEGYCESCHGADGSGVSGPALTERLPVMTSSEILEQIEDGGNDMPAYRGQFSDQDLADLLEYLTLTFQ